jgi:hypothetical protein
MTVKEMFENKYRERMKNIREREWQYIKEIAEAKKMHPAQVIIMGLAITATEANPRKNAEVYRELIEMNQNKLIASNRHRQYSGKVDAFWLTKKGYKQLFGN